MNEDEQRIAIAKACGFYNCSHDPILGWRGQHPERSGYRKPIPDYLHDLNAMHEAEEMLECRDLNGQDLMSRYRGCLEHLTVGVMGGAIRATAKQRAEAFLRTIGKWKE